MEVQGTQTTQQTPSSRPKTWLLESILTTIFCCLPFGIVGIINASKVDSLYAQGLYAEAAKASADAKKWTMWALIAGVVVSVIYGILMALGVMSGFANM